MIRLRLAQVFASEAVTFHERTRWEPLLSPGVIRMPVKRRRNLRVVVEGFHLLTLSLKPSVLKQPMAS